MNKIIAIQGAEGSNHHKVARDFYGENIQLKECMSFDALVAHLLEGSATDGVMAIENTIAGSIIPNYALIDSNNLHIVGEEYLNIHHHLMALPNQTINSINEVWSHPMALLQCKEFFKKHPHIKLVEDVDTAEVAKRIAEKEGSKSYGIISVLTQAFFDVEYLFTVPPSVFNPPPKVDSGVIRLIRKTDFSLSVDEKLFFRVVKTAFNQRRKMLRSSLKSFNISDTLKEDAIFAMRPEQLSVSEFIKLTQKIATDVI